MPETYPLLPENGGADDAFVAYLRTRIAYAAAAGQFTSLVPRRGVRNGYVGMQGASANKIAPRIMIDNTFYRRDRLVWLFETGEWRDDIATLNRNPSDTRFRNLHARGMADADTARHFARWYTYHRGSGGLFHVDDDALAGYKTGDRADYRDPTTRRVYVRGAPRNLRPEELVWLLSGNEIEPGFVVRRSPEAPQSAGTWLAELVHRKATSADIVAGASVR